MGRSEELTARMEPFDSFWEGPKDIEKGYSKFAKFYRHNYLKHVPSDRQTPILVISCGPGYFVNLLIEEGYTNVLGLDSSEEKIAYARKKKLNCRVARAFEFLDTSSTRYGLIFCEQELNHLTKDEMLEFLVLCRQNLLPGGVLVTHGLNGANPITGAEALAQNFDHFNTFTEYTMRQVLEYTEFENIRIIPLRLYVFWANPANYILMLVSALYTGFFRLSFIMYGKTNKIFTKKIGAICTNRSAE